jgi:hypothetical protein
LGRDWQEESKAKRKKKHRFRRCLQLKVKRRIAAGYAAWVAIGKQSQKPTKKEVPLSTMDTKSAA